MALLRVSRNASEICRFVRKFASGGDPVFSRSHLSYAPEGLGEVTLISEAGREPDFEDAQICVSQHLLSALDAPLDHILVGTDTSAAQNGAGSVPGAKTRWCATVSSAATMRLSSKRAVGVRPKARMSSTKPVNSVSPCVIFARTDSTRS